MCYCEWASGLRNNKMSGSDGIPAEFFKYAPTFILEWPAVFIISELTHTHVPCSLTDIIIKPGVYRGLKDFTDSGNYKPMALASSAFKIIDKNIYDRFMACIGVSNIQFGFKRNNTTDQCNFALKETLTYYRKMKTPGFACVIDIKSTFHSVDTDLPVSTSEIVVQWSETVC